MISLLSFSCQWLNGNINFADSAILANKTQVRKVASFNSDAKSWTIQCAFSWLQTPDILLNRSQQLFSSCTAKFADGQQCSVPVFDITHQTPLCEEHAKKMVSLEFA